MKNKGFTFLEVVVSLAILLAGILTIVNLFPLTLKATSRAAMISKATLLSQLKAEEIRRDNRVNSVPDLIAIIRNLDTPTEPRPFSEDPRFTYSYCGTSLIDPTDDPDDPRDDAGVARVIVRYNPVFNPNEDILFELRFAE